MIKVDCGDIEFVKHRLSVYVADRVGAIPALKHHEFLLSPMEDDKKIESADVIASIKEFLNAMGESKNFDVTEHKNLILIKSISRKTIQRKSRDSNYDHDKNIKKITITQRIMLMLGLARVREV